MIVHKINIGRMGNQFFQIAATIGHSVKMDTVACFPKWVYNQYLLNPIDDSLNTENDNIFNGIMHEDHFGFGTRYQQIENSPNLVLHGFFQSERYFEHCKDLIVYHFKPKHEFLKVVREAGKDFLNLQNLVAVHIRRGDYIENQDRHPVLSPSYYVNSLVKLSEKLSVPIKDINIVIFSDDIEWCKQNSFVDNIYFSEGNSDIVDLYLMAQCKHHIIANSSFSWWGSWLAKNVFQTSGHTFAPKRWFGSAIKPEETQDLYLEDWTKVDE